MSEDTEHLQDAPPLVGATAGAEGSSTLSPSKLTASLEVEIQQKGGPGAEGADLEVTSAECLGAESLNQMVELREAEGPPGEIEAVEDRVEETHSEKAEPELATGAASLLASPTIETDGEQEGESGEEGLEQEVTSNDKQKVEEVPKHRRTYCRNTSCVNCKVPCGACCDCTNSNSKRACRERAQCPDKKPRDLSKVLKSEGLAEIVEANTRSRDISRKSMSEGGTPLKIPDIFRAPSAPEDSKNNRKRKQGKTKEEDKKRRNTSTEPNIEEVKLRRNSLAAPLDTSHTPTKTRRPSGLPVSRAAPVIRVEGVAPQGVVAMPNP